MPVFLFGSVFWKLKGVQGSNYTNNYGKHYQIEVLGYTAVC